MNASAKAHPRSKLIAELLAVRGTPKLSILLSTHRTDPAQDAIRLRHHLAYGRSALVQWGLSKAEATELTDALEGLPGPERFWPTGTAAVAIYVAKGFRRILHLREAVDEYVGVADDFDIAPIIRHFDGAHCYLLTLSRGEPRLWRATQTELNPVELPDAPEDLSEITRFDDPEKQLQYHQTGRKGRDSLAPAFHGQGIGEAHDREAVTKYLRAVDRAVVDAVRQTPGPMLLAGPEDLVGRYRTISSCPQIVEWFVHSHPDGLDREMLHRSAIEVLSQRAEERASRAAGAFEGLRKTKTVASGVGRVVTAAADGRVDVLLFEPGRRLWGRFDGERRRVWTESESSPGAEDLVNRAVVETLRHGGSVLPAIGADGLRALLRY